MKWFTTRVTSSIYIKLIFPIVVSFLLAIAGFYVVVEHSTDTLVSEKLNSRAYELAESFVVATEINHVRANFIRVINSIGAYEDIKMLFLMDDSTGQIIASSRNQYIGKVIRSVADSSLRQSLLTAVNSPSDYFWDTESGQHYFAYKTQLMSENKSSLRECTVFMEIDISSSENYIASISFYYITTLLAIVSILTIVQFIFVRKAVLRPIFQLVDSIKQTKKNNAPVISQYKSKDQIGVLTQVYNELILDSFQKQLQLAEAREKSVASSQAKSQFLAMITHELRTPLNAVIGMSNKLNEKVSDGDERRYVKVIQSSANQLLSIINDTLDFSKIEVNKLTLHIQPFDLLEAVRSVVNMFEMQLEQQPVNMIFSYPQQKLPLVEGDSVRLIQVVVNLIGNSIKFTEQGSIEVTLFIEQQTDKQLIFFIKVKDSGIGLTQAQQKTLFEEFSQADSPTTRKYGGTGLGLWIGKNIIEKMNGQITVDSQIGQGAAFRISLSLPVVEKEKAVELSSNHPEADINTLGPTNILLVESTEINRMVVMAILDFENVHFHIADNGQQAVEAFAQKTFDLILMDCLMPTMDGFEVSRAIRKMEKQYVNNDNIIEDANGIPIIAIIASVLENTKQQCIESGIDEFLTKPIIPEKLRRSVAYYVSGRHTKKS